MNALRVEKTTVTVQYNLPLPTNAVELSKALNWANKEYAEYRNMHWSDMADDALTITTEDDVLVISWVK